MNPLIDRNVAGVSCNVVWLCRGVPCSGGCSVVEVVAAVPGAAVAVVVVVV